MIRLRELLQQIIETRQKNMAGILAMRSGVTRKPGYGNYGIGDFITHRSIKGQLKPVIPHRIGEKPTLTGKPEPTIRFKGQPKPPAE
jgi:hypothetical protein